MGMFSGRISAINSLSPAARAISEPAHQCCTDSLPLVPVDHGESHLRLSGLQDDVTSAADDRESAIFFHHCDQGDVIDEIHMQEELDFLVRKAAFRGEETTEERLRACAADGCKELGSVFRPQRADFDTASIARQLNRRILRCFRHSLQLYHDSNQATASVACSVLPAAIRSVNVDGEIVACRGSVTN